MPNDQSHLDDVDVIDRVLRGDTNAFESLVVKYRDHVFKIVRKHVPRDESEETAQEVFIRAFQSLASFKGKSRFQSWISTIAVRTCYDYWREAYRSRELPMSSLTERRQEWLETVISDQSDRSFNEADSQKEAEELLDWALERLSPEDRMVLELIYLEGLSVKAASSLLGWSIANVKVRSFRSRRKLQKLLADFMER